LRGEEEVVPGCVLIKRSRILSRAAFQPLDGEDDEAPVEEVANGADTQEQTMHKYVAIGGADDDRAAGWLAAIATVIARQALTPSRIALEGITTMRNSAHISAVDVHGQSAILCERYARQ